MEDEDLHRLIEDVRQRRGTDTIVVFERANLSSVDFVALDQFAERAGLAGIGEDWRELKREAALCLVSELLARDLAYDVRLMLETEAQQLAERFANVFDHNARFFTNTDEGIDSSSWGWTPLTKSTFDAGVIAVDMSTIGVLVVQDED